MDIDNRTILQKADLQISDLTTGGGLLVPAQAKKFIRLLIDEAVILQMATVTPMRSHKAKAGKSRFTSRILRAGTSQTALPIGDRSKPDLGEVELDAQLFKAEVRLDNEVLEDNIEGGTFKSTVMSQMSEAIARDMDEIIVNGDTASSDTFLAKFDGMLKQSTSNIVNAAANPITSDILRDMLKTMPSPFMRAKNRMAFLTSTDAEIDYRDLLSDRATQVGDKHLEKDSKATYSGVPMHSVPLFPENLGGGSNETNIILTDPKNINVGIWRDIRIETDKLVSEGQFLIVATLRFDMKYIEETATVKATGVTVS